METLSNEQDTETGSIIVLDPPAETENNPIPPAEIPPDVLPALPAFSTTATVDAEIKAAVLAMNAVHALRENDGAMYYAEVVTRLGHALKTESQTEGQTRTGAIKAVRDKLIKAVKERTETPRLVWLEDTQGGVTYALPPEKQPKPKPGAYIQAYTRVLDLARWLPGVELWRGVKETGKGPKTRGEAPIPYHMAKADTDTPDATGMVNVQGTYYVSPVSALLGGNTLESVHQAWVNRVRPTVINLDAFRVQGAAAIRAGFSKWTVTLQDKSMPGGRKRVKAVATSAMLCAVLESAYKAAGAVSEDWLRALDKVAVECMAPRAMPPIVTPAIAPATQG